MPLFVNDKRIWPAGKIKYLLVKDPKDAEASIEEINDLLGYQLFEKITAEPAKDTPYVEIAAGSGNANTIGYQGAKKHPMTGGKAATFQHEMLHVIGFFHEQYHDQYPWIAADAGLPAQDKIIKDNMFSFKNAKTKKVILQEQWNIDVYTKLVEKFGTDMGGDTDRRKYYGYINDKTVEHMDPCDFSSVMMYGDAAAAILDLRKDKEAMKNWPKAIKFTQGKKVSKIGAMSEHDIKALQKLYPKPR